MKKPKISFRVCAIQHEGKPNNKKKGNNKKATFSSLHPAATCTDSGTRACQPARLAVMIVNNLADRVARLNKLISRERTYYDPPAPQNFRGGRCRTQGNGRVVGARPRQLCPPAPRHANAAGNVPTYSERSGVSVKISLRPIRP